MEFTMKTVTSGAAPVAPALLGDAAGLGHAAVVPLTQALSAIGEPDTTVDLAQRLGATVAMLWSDVDVADLFLPQGSSGELRGMRDAAAGPALLGAVGVPYGTD